MGPNTLLPLEKKGLLTRNKCTNRGAQEGRLCDEDMAKKGHPSKLNAKMRGANPGIGATAATK